MKLKEKFVLLLLFFLLIQSGCVEIPDDIIAPRWDVDFNVPLTNKKYVLSEIIKPQKFIELDSDDSYIFSSETYRNSYDINEFLDQSDKPVVLNTDILAANGAVDIYLPFPGSIKVNKAEFRDGVIKFSAVNLSSEFISFNIELPGFKDVFDNPLIAQLSLDAGRADSVDLYIGEYKYSRPEYQDSTLDGGILIRASAFSSSNLAPAQISFSATQFKFKSATGYFPVKQMKPRSHVIKMKLGSDIADFAGNLYLSNALLKLKTSYIARDNNPFEVKITNLQVFGRRYKDNDENMLSFNNAGPGGTISTAISFEPGYIDTAFDESNSNINEFVAFFPDELELTSAYIMNPNDDQVYRSVTEGDSLMIESYLSTKGIGLNSNALLAIRRSSLTDTLSLDLSESDRDAIRDGQTADLKIQVTNSIPMSSWIKIIITDENYNPLSVITTGNDGSDSMEFLGAEVDHSTGEVTEASENLQNLILTSEQILNIAEAEYVILSVSLETSSFNDLNPTYVKLKASDWIEIRVQGTIKYNVNLDD